MILFYDHLLTFGDEVQYIWSAPSTYAKSNPLAAPGSPDISPLAFALWETREGLSDLVWTRMSKVKKMLLNTPSRLWKCLASILQLMRKTEV